MHVNLTFFWASTVKVRFLVGSIAQFMENRLEKSVKNEVETGGYIALEGL